VTSRSPQAVLETPIPEPSDQSQQGRDRESVDLLTQAEHAPPGKQQSLRDQVVALNMDLAANLARRYSRRSIPDEDLRQVAFLGLLKAVRGFCPDRSDSFTAYAIPTIRGELRRHFRDTGWTVRPPRRIQELQARVRAVEADLVHALHRSPTVKELAEAVGADVEDVTETVAASSCFSPLSLDAPTSEDGQELGATLEAPDHGFASAEARLLLGSAVRRLGDRDRTVLELRFFEGLTQQEIGDRLGVSQMQVSRILNRILTTLRGEIVGSEAA
jgi:RNA polymerase sigma-B factor